MLLVEFGGMLSNTFYLVWFLRVAVKSHPLFFLYTDVLEDFFIFNDDPV